LLATAFSFLQSFAAGAVFSSAVLHVSTHRVASSTDFTQVCFFQPALPLFFFSAFDPFLVGFPFDSNYPDTAGGLSSVDTMRPEIATNPMAGPVDADTSAAEGQNSPSRRTATVDASPEAAKTDASTFFLLILKNGTRQAVTDYWLDDGYVEFASDDSVWSHIPRDALELKKTVIENSAAGLSFCASIRAGR
jgi:hypothetical protein